MVFNFLNNIFCTLILKRDHDYFVLHMLVSLEDMELKILCNWFNFLLIHYRLNFNDHALCFI